MKKIIFILVVVFFGAVVLFVSCKPSVKEKEAQENIDEAKEDLAEARKQANEEEWQNFKNDMNATIDKNDARIEELKQDMKNRGKEANVEYEKRVDALKEKNDSLKAKMNSYKNDVNSDWQSFKSEFNHDMNELGDALKDFTVKNQK